MNNGLPHIDTSKIFAVANTSMHLENQAEQRSKSFGLGFCLQVSYAEYKLGHGFIFGLAYISPIGNKCVGFLLVMNCLPALDKVMQVMLMLKKVNLGTRVQSNSVKLKLIIDKHINN